MTSSEILNLFVAKIDSREFLLKPFRIGDFVYATNGHWCARVPAEGIDADARTDKHPKNVEALFDAAPTEGFIPLPKVEDPGSCFWCDGRGCGISSKCDSCDGLGEFEKDGWRYDCQACEGEGTTFRASAIGTDCCPYCEGLGVPVLAANGTKVGESTYANRYLWLLSKLPGIEIAPGEKEKAARIRFDGGEGLLMPYRG